MNTDTRQQRKAIWITIIACVTIMAMVLVLFLNKMLSPRIMSVAELRVNGAIVFDKPRIINEFQLIDHNAEAFTLQNLKAKWTLVYFGFTHCPDICPTTLAKLSQVVKQLDDDIANETQVLMISVDPARDTPEKLQEYVPYFHPDFIGVTGEFVQIMSVAQNVNVAFNKVMLDDDYTVDHTGNIVLINPYGHYHGFFRPPFELAKLKTTFQSIVKSFDG